MYLETWLPRWNRETQFNLFRLSPLDVNIEFRADASFGLAGIFGFFVRFDDLLNQPMSNDISLQQARHADSLDGCKSLQGIFQPALRTLRQVDLGCVARYNDFGIFTHSCQKHFHLADGLRFEPHPR